MPTYRLKAVKMSARELANGFLNELFSSHCVRVCYLEIVIDLRFEVGDTHQSDEIRQHLLDILCQIGYDYRRIKMIGRLIVCNCGERFFHWRL